MPNLIFIHKSNKLINKVDFRCQTQNLGITLWNQYRQGIKRCEHKRKIFIHKGEYLDSNFNIRQDYLIFRCEYEPDSFIYHVLFRFCVDFTSKWWVHFKSYNVAKNCFKINWKDYKDCLKQYKNLKKINFNPNLRFNTDPYFFTKNWYYALCKKTGNFLPDDIILFGTFININQIELDLLFVIKDLIPNVFQTKRNRIFLNPTVSKTQIEKRYLRMALPPNEIPSVIKRGNSIYRAKLYHQNKNCTPIFSFVPVKLWKIHQNYTVPIIDIFNLFNNLNINLNRVPGPYQNYVYLGRNLSESEIQAIFDGIINQIFSQGYYLGIKFY
jgi:hypothetical protein